MKSFYFIILLYLSTLAVGYGQSPTQDEDLSVYREKVTFKNPYKSLDIKPIRIDQGIDDSSSEAALGGMVIIFQIDSLLQHRLDLFETRIEQGEYIMGYRIQFYLGDVNTAHAKNFTFRNYFPGYETYVTYEQPIHKCTAGNFRFRSEADLFLKKVRKYFPGAFVVQKQIKTPQ